MSESESIMPMPENALDLMTNKFDRERPYLDVIWGPLSGTLSGFGLIAFINFGYRRPLLSGIHRHILAAAIGCVGMDYLYKRRNEYVAEKDAQLRHYIMLHPEYFPMPERKKFSEVLDEWVPIR